MVHPRILNLETFSKVFNFYNFKTIMDLIPGDMVTNMTLAAAWNTSLNKYPFVPVFNISSGMINPLTAKEFITDYIPQYVRKYPLGRKSFNFRLFAIYQAIYSCFKKSWNLLLLYKA